MIYTFRIKGTEEYFNLQMPMADRETYLENNPDIEQVIVSAPMFIDPMKLGRMNASQKDFQKNVIGRMKHAIPKNNLGDSKFQIPKEI